MITRNISRGGTFANDAGFNAQLLKSIRKELRWTQRELSERSQLSVRVIAKAESGSPISRPTIETLVKCLKQVGKTVSSQDFVVDQLACVGQFFRNYARYGADAVTRSRGLLSPDLEVHMDGDVLLNPLAGNYRGCEAFAALLKKFFGIFVRDGGTLGDTTQMRLVGQEVIAWGHEFIRIPQVASAPPTFMMLHFHLQGGQIIRIEWLYDAAGLMDRLACWLKKFPDADWAGHFSFAIQNLEEGWLTITAAEQSSGLFNHTTTTLQADLRHIP